MKEYYKHTGREKITEELIHKLRHEYNYDYNYCHYSIDYDDYPLSSLKLEGYMLNTCCIYNKYKIVKDHDICYYYNECKAPSDIIIHNKFGCFSGFCIQHYYLLYQADREEIISVHMPEEMNSIIERYELVKFLM